MMYSKEQLKVCESAKWVGEQGTREDLARIDYAAQKSRVSDECNVIIAICKKQREVSRMVEEIEQLEGELPEELLAHVMKKCPSCRSMLRSDGVCPNELCDFDLQLYQELSENEESFRVCPKCGHRIVSEGFCCNPLCDFRISRLDKLHKLTT